MTPKSISTWDLVLIAAAALTWLVVAINLSFVAGKSGTGDAAMGKALSTVVAVVCIVVTWVLLAVLLLLAGARDVMPGWAPAAIMPLFLLSGAAAIAAVVLLDDPHRVWPVAIPLVLPALIVAFVIRPQTGAVVWSLVLVISLAPWPVVFRTSSKVTPRPPVLVDDSKRDQALARLRQMTPESHLWDWFSLLDRESGVQQEALAAFRTNPNRQADVESWLGGSLVTMQYVAALDLTPTPPLCAAALQWCRKFAQEMLPQNGQPSYYEEKQLLEPALQGLRWFKANGCRLDEGLAAIEQSLKEYRDTPHRRQMQQQMTASVHPQ